MSTVTVQNGSVTQFSKHTIIEKYIHNVVVSRVLK